MMEEFITWSMLGDVVKLTSIVLTATQFTKNIPGINKIPTKFWSWMIAFFLIIMFNIDAKTFTLIDIVLYALSSMFISASANGIYMAGEKKLKTEEPEQLDVK